MLNKLKIMVLIGICALGAAGCAPPVEVAHANACDIENDGLTIAVEGYLSPGSGVYCSDVSGNYRCGLDFTSAPGADDAFSADVIEGTGRNRMAPLESGYSLADFKITTDSGEVISLDVPVTIIGKIRVSEVTETKVCYMYVSKIQNGGGE